MHPLLGIFILPQTAIVKIEYNSDYGNVSGSGEYEIREKVELIATQKEGYEFVGWMEDGEETNSSKKLTYFLRKTES